MKIFTLYHKCITDVSQMYHRWPWTLCALVNSESSLILSHPEYAFKMPPGVTTCPRRAAVVVPGACACSVGTTSRCSGRWRRGAPGSCAPVSGRPLAATAWTAAWRGWSASAASRRPWGRGNSSRSGGTWPWRSRPPPTPPSGDAGRYCATSRCPATDRCGYSGCCGRGWGPLLDWCLPSSWCRLTRGCGGVPRRAPAGPSGSWWRQPPARAHPTTDNSLEHNTAEQVNMGSQQRPPNSRFQFLTFYMNCRYHTESCLVTFYTDSVPLLKSHIYWCTVKTTFMQGTT